MPEFENYAIIDGVRGVRASLNDWGSGGQDTFPKAAVDVFVDYAHDDFPRVDPIVRLLTGMAKLNVWFDARGGNASKDRLTY